MKDVPQWVEQHAHKCMLALNLTAFPITFKMVSQIGDDSDTAGEAHVNFRYLRATIYLRDDLDDDAKGRAVITHEMYHVAFAQLSRVYMELRELLPKHAHSLVEDMWANAVEQTVELLSRSLTPLLDEMALEHIPQPSHDHSHTGEENTLAIGGEQ